jgi:hypothetical protein
VATTPKYYYGSNVTYELHVSDSIGNNVVLRDTTYIMFDPLSASDGIGPYLGHEQTITLSAGTYVLECWGANGGSANGQAGGKGGYSTGTITLPTRTTLYISVGGVGTNGSANYALQNPGGFNGGGNGGSSGIDGSGAGGGGATHIATSTGVLSALLSNQTAILITAGGGGGAGYYSGCTGGNGGGATGANGLSSGGYPGLGATQTAGGNITAGATYVATAGVFGNGGNGYIGTGGGNGGGGGGGGYYGGGGGATGYNTSSCGAGGGGSGYIGGVTASITAQLGTSGYVANPDVSGHGYVRIKTTAGKIIDGGKMDVYTGNDLAIFNLVSPVNDPNSICSPDNAPVKIALWNLGENDYDFTQDKITIGYEIINPQRTIYSGDITVDTGDILSGESAEIELMSALPILAGNYTIKAWVTSSLDAIRCDDTLHYTYTSNKVNLPISDNFSSGSLPVELVSSTMVGTGSWDPYTPDPSDPVQPDFGTGVLRFAGTPGSMAVLSSWQLDLYGASQPKMEFWYYHDASIAVMDNTYTDVNVIVDGVRNTVMTLYKRGASTGWQQYPVDLTPFTGNAQCVLIQFESMNRYAGSYQYMDSLIITSQQDLEVAAIVLPGLSVCDLTNQTLSVVIRTRTTQSIDFTTNPTHLEVDIKGTKYSLPLQGLLAGNMYDTLTYPYTIALDTGNYTIKAYVTTPVDGAPLNDTAKYTIDLRPSLSLTVIPSSDALSPIDAGLAVNQMITIRNTGNIPLSNIRLRLRVLVIGQPDIIIEETLGDTILAPTDSMSYYPLTNTYLVPWVPAYGIVVEAMGCDSAKIYASGSTSEYANIDNLEIRRIDNPSGSIPDTIGQPVYVKITLQNRSKVINYQDIKATVVVRLSNQALSGVPYSETLPFQILASSDTTSFTFATSYTVPNDNLYTVTVFIADALGNRLDHFPTDDTLTVTRNAVAPIGITNIEGNGNGISMSQNIPNPSNGTTRIDYSLPTDGEVTFHVYTISGQELFNQVVETTSGKHSIELNTTSLASGIYFYSMEFKGQRIVKRMSVAL